MDFIMQPWPTGQGFGISTSFQQIGALCSPNSKLNYFRDFNKRKGMWTLMFAAGVAAGGFIANHWLSAQPVVFLPESYMSMGGAVRLLIGGILVGFGTRYAGGCTSGHAITGISNLNWPSLVATIFFNRTTYLKRNHKTARRCVRAHASHVAFDGDVLRYRPD